MVSSLPAGDYRLVIDNGGRTGSYQLGVGLQPAAQSFALSLPRPCATAIPPPGRGILETTSSEDDSTFSTTGLATVTLSSLSAPSMIHYDLIDTGDDHKLKTGTLSCGHATQDRGAPAGSYKLVVTNNGKKGTYTLKLEASPKETFVSALPFAISDGVPSAGCGQFGDRRVGGRLHVPTTTATGNLQIDISIAIAAPVGLGALQRDRHGHQRQLVSQGWSCWSQMVSSLPAGDYRLVIDNGGRTGSYQLGVGLQPAAQSFALSLPKTVSNGDPTTGAGILRRHPPRTIHVCDDGGEHGDARAS